MFFSCKGCSQLKPTAAFLTFTAIQYETYIQKDVSTNSRDKKVPENY